MRLFHASRAAVDERPYTFQASIETTLLACSLFWAVACNRLFFGAALKDHAGGSVLLFALASGTALVALHYLLLAPWATRWTTKPLLALMIVATAFATYFMTQFGVYLDPSMLRNVLRTDVHEARELLGWNLVPALLLYAGLPLLLLWRVRFTQRRWPRALAIRLASVVLALAVLVAAVLSVFQPLASLMRNQTQLRYLITPGNYVWSLAAVAGMDARAAAGPRVAIGTDAVRGPGWAQRQRPTLLVLVVGETARAANWGLSGYARQTTPELAQLPVLNFSQVTSCGTNTEVSLPCMFAPVGRRDYDERRIRSSESLLHVLARAGIAVQWRDNQSGCKGVCDGLPNELVTTLQPAGLCAEGRCLDEGLLHQLGALEPAAGQPKLLVLHMLGNHGPSYFRRYPAAFDRFAPACKKDDLRQCSREEIVNAYDNALLYTDHVLARLIRALAERADALDSAVLYVSDHGESLGENNLFLHGLPYAIAPDVQKQVPMVMWFSDGWRRSTGLDAACMKQRATAPASHDHLFHTVLGLMDVHTTAYSADWDLTAPCRPSR